MSKQNQSSFLRTLAASVTAFGSAAVLLFPFSTISTHGRATTPVRSANSRNAASRPHIAKLQASNSPEGSRVALTADQSLNDYEAFRRGDRFFLKIPPAAVSRADDLRVRAFTDVRVEHTADATFVIFHLWPGVTAHVQQWGHKLEIVFTVSRPRLANLTPVAPAGIRKHGRATSIRTDSKRDLNAGTIRSKTTIPAVSKVANSGSRAANRVSEDHRTSRIVLPAAPRAQASAKTESASVKSSHTSELAMSSVVPEREIRSRAAASTAPVSGSETSSSSNLKHSARYLVRVAQLNPVPVGVGVAILLLFLGLVFLQRRGTRRTFGVGSLTQSDLPGGLGKSRPAFVTADFAQCTRAASQTESNTRGRAIGVPGTGRLIDKLVLDNAHRADVLGSRSPEDRKAIEASLINLITAADIKPEDRRRVRVALEEYGFVARHCATLLTGRDGWERASAARTLAQIGAHSSLPFLIEALHDDDSIVRNQAVASLASLKDPAAIGALVEAARTYPDVPASLFSETLSACSVDSLGPLDLPSAETVLLSDIVEEDKADTFQELAAKDDDVLSGWLEQLNSADEKLEAFPDSLPPFTEAHERPYLTLVA
jgi:hypothetical protein